MRGKNNAARKLILRVKEIKGNCPVYKVGDKIVIEQGYRLNCGESDTICMHSLASVMPYYVALSRGASPAELGIANKQGKACLQCLDPAAHTGGGTVTFQIDVAEA